MNGDCSHLCLKKNRNELWVIQNWCGGVSTPLLLHFITYVYFQLPSLSTHSHFHLSFELLCMDSSFVHQNQAQEEGPECSNLIPGTEYIELSYLNKASNFIELLSFTRHIEISCFPPKSARNELVRVIASWNHALASQKFETWKIVKCLNDGVGWFMPNSSVCDAELLAILSLLLN